MERKKVNEIELWFDEFIREKECQGLAKATLFDYKDAYNRFIKETNGELNKQTFQDWTQVFKEKGAIKSINHYLGHMRVFVNWCIKNEYIEHFTVKLIKQQQSKIVYYEDSELQKLLKKPSIKANFREYRTYVMISFLIATGCRIGTLINIKIEDVDLKNQEVTYRHLKTRESAVIPLTQSICGIIKEYLSIWDVKDYLFCDYNNKQMTTNSCRLSLEKYCNDRGVKSLGLHSFRRSFARLWVVNGGDPFSLQHMLCHSTLDMTKHYCALFGNDLHQHMNAYSPLDKLNSDSHIKRK